MVEDGDVFVVLQFYFMVQLFFVNSFFMFMGFSILVKMNYFQFLVGQNLVLKIFNWDVFVMFFNMRYVIVERLLGIQKDGLLLECVFCVEVEFFRFMREIEERRRCEEEEIEWRKREEEEVKR